MNNENIIFYILKFLPIVELFQFSLINKKFHQVSNCWMLWQYKLKDNLGILEITQTDIYKCIYMKYLKLQHEYFLHSSLIKMHPKNNVTLPFNTTLETISFDHETISHYKCALFSTDDSNNKNVVGYKNLKLTIVTPNKFLDIFNSILIELISPSFISKFKEDLLLLLYKKYRIIPSIKVYSTNNMWYHEIHLPFDKLFYSEYIPKKFMLRIDTESFNEHKIPIQDLFISFDLLRYEKPFHTINHCIGMNILGYNHISSKHKCLETGNYNGSCIISDVYLKFQNESNEIIPNVMFDNVNIVFNDNVYKFERNMVQKIDSGHYHIALLQEGPEYFFQQNEKPQCTKMFNIKFDNLQHDVHCICFYVFYIDIF